ncbi:Palmitoyltransferase, DHHC domain [Sesbania bispinosa]|nr:Palmitoyltransferase, DHHC domain [Sesbania bispinosa]
MAIKSHGFIMPVDDLIGLQPSLVVLSFCLIINALMNCMEFVDSLELGSLGLLGEYGGDLRYCQKCSHYKPPRAHHCRVCKRCVLRMDHHCIWINNCVGHANYKVFFIFVMYAVIACIYSLVLLVGSLAYDGTRDEEKNGGSFRTVYVVSGILLVPLSIALCVLLGWHIYLVLHNKTTIEYHEGVRALWLAEKGGSIYKHPYDLGPYENLTSVLGPNILSWLWPTANHIGSGLRFRTVYDLTQGASASK